MSTSDNAREMAHSNSTASMNTTGTYDDMGKSTSVEAMNDGGNNPVKNGKGSLGTVSIIHKIEEIPFSGSIDPNKHVASVDSMKLE